MKAQALKLMGLDASRTDVLYLDHLVDRYVQTTAKENASFESFKALCMDAIGDECCQFEERTMRNCDTCCYSFAFLVTK